MRGHKETYPSYSGWEIYTNGCKQNWKDSVPGYTNRSLTRFPIIMKNCPLWMHTGKCRRWIQIYGLNTNLRNEDLPGICCAHRRRTRQDRRGKHWIG